MGVRLIGQWRWRERCLDGDREGVGERWGECTRMRGIDGDLVGVKSFIVSTIAHIIPLSHISPAQYVNAINSWAHSTHSHTRISKVVDVGGSFWPLKHWDAICLFVLVSGQSTITLALTSVQDSPSSSLNTYLLRVWQDLHIDLKQTTPMLVPINNSYMP